MIGPEYNWLVSPSRSATGLVRVRVVGDGTITLLVGLLCVMAMIARIASSPALAAIG
jgi:hypothetical protein